MVITDSAGYAARHADLVDLKTRDAPAVVRGVAADLRERLACLFYLRAL
jgi:hypothetical protein